MRNFLYAVGQMLGWIPEFPEDRWSDVPWVDCHKVSASVTGKRHITAEFEDRPVKCPTCSGPMPPWRIQTVRESWSVAFTTEVGLGELNVGEEDFRKLQIGNVFSVEFEIRDGGVRFFRHSMSV